MGVGVVWLTIFELVRRLSAYVFTLHYAVIKMVISLYIRLRGVYMFCDLHHAAKISIRGATIDIFICIADCYDREKKAND